METSETTQLLEVTSSSVAEQRESEVPENVWCCRIKFCTFRVRIITMVAIIIFQLPFLLYYISTSEHDLWNINSIYHPLILQRFFANSSARMTTLEEIATSPTNDIQEIGTIKAALKKITMPSLRTSSSNAHNDDNNKTLNEQVSKEPDNKFVEILNDSSNKEDDIPDAIKPPDNISSGGVSSKENVDKAGDDVNDSVDNLHEEVKSEDDELKTNEIMETTPQPKSTDGQKDEVILPPCPNEPPNLQGHLEISFDKEPKEFNQTLLDNPLVKRGGHGQPAYCIAKWKVAIIIPYRNRMHHLKYFVQFMHPSLQRQQVDYQIFIINQFGMGKFNRAKLMNIGFLEALKIYPFQCFAYHDVDLILEDDRSLYWCSDRPRHLSAGVDKFNYVLPYSSIFGGVTLISKSQMEDINGFSNSFWGWGGEDDDVFNRLHIRGHKIIRYPMNIAKYRMISHKREKGNEANPKRFDLIRKTKQTMTTDGLNSIDYKVISIEYESMYTNITVDVKGPN